MVIMHLVACLVTDTNSCKQFNLQFSDIKVNQCYSMPAQYELTKWVELHPNYIISKWNCDEGEKKDA